ncbi:MAG: N-glycosylase/DNA lyase, partial [Cetobacterium sp.]
MKNDYFFEMEKIYESIKERIENRVQDFKKVWIEGDNKDIFCELAFCILTPQSKARSASKAITGLVESDVLFTGTEEQILPYLNVVRFNKTKAKNLYLLRQQMIDENGKFITKDFFSKFESVFEMREWIVKNIRGMS